MNVLVYTENIWYQLKVNGDPELCRITVECKNPYTYIELIHFVFAVYRSRMCLFISMSIFKHFVLQTPQRKRTVTQPVSGIYLAGSSTVTVQYSSHNIVWNIRLEGGWGTSKLLQLEKIEISAQAQTILYCLECICLWLSYGQSGGGIFLWY